MALPVVIDVARDGDLKSIQSLANVKGAAVH